MHAVMCQQFDWYLSLIRGKRNNTVGNTHELLYQQHADISVVGPDLAYRRRLHQASTVWDGDTLIP